MTNEVRQLCQLVARLADAVEGIAKDVEANELEISRIHVVRHEVLMLARAMDN